MEVGRGVAEGATGVGVGKGVAVAVGSRVEVGRETAVSGEVWVAVAAGGMVADTTAVGLSCPAVWVQATRASRRAAEIEYAAVSFKA